MCIILQCSSSMDLLQRSGRNAGRRKLIWHIPTVSYDVDFPPPQIKRAGFSAPTPIQAQAWPVAMAGRDLVAIAKTGSGKTCGFLLPGMLHINATRKVGQTAGSCCCALPCRIFRTSRCTAIMTTPAAPCSTGAETAVWNERRTWDGVAHP